MGTAADSLHAHVEARESWGGAMSLRFRRSVKLAPGVRMNFSGSGLSWSLGPRGASVGVGKRGAFLNTGISGTGLSSRQRLSGGSRGASSSGSLTTKTATVSVADDGTITLRDGEGRVLSEMWLAAAKKQHGDTLKGLISEKVEELNETVEALAKVYLATPAPKEPKYLKAPFEAARPERPVPEKIGLLGRIFRGRRERIESANAAAMADFERRVAAWETAGKLHEELEEQKRKRHEEHIRSDLEAMERVITEVLEEMPWPRETNVSFDVLDSGRRVDVDVDLPEIEDMQLKVAATTGRGFEIKFNEMSATKLRQLYMRHVHAVGFRVIGEVMARLPACEGVVLSAFSQRPNRQTGHVEDQYLYSVKVPRRLWREIDFSNLEELDVVGAFERFDLRRAMSKTGVFQPIEPFETENVTSNSGPP